jgi:hypothetical protein
MFGHTWKFVKVGWEMIKEAHEYYWALTALGLTIPVAIPLWLSWDNPASRGPLFALAIVLWAILFLCLLGYYGHRESTKIAIPLAIPAKATEPIKPLTLREYFNTDFHFGGFNDDKVIRIGSTNEPCGREVTISCAIKFDFSANAEFLCIYVPSFVNAYIVLQSFPSLVSQLRTELKSGPSMEFSEGLYQDMHHSNALKFTGRIFIYHEDDLSTEQLGSLITLYKSHGLTPDFRGPNYREIKWLQDQAIKTSN